MNKATKEELVSEFRDIFSQAQSGVLIDYKGLTVEEITQLRKNLFNQGARLRVVKNTLAKIAAKDTPCEPLEDNFVKTRAFVYSMEDSVSPAKLSIKAAEENEKIEVVAGVLNSDGKGELLDYNSIKALGSLPSKEVLLTKLVYVLNAPTTNFVRVLNEIPTSFVRALQAVADTKE